MPFSRHLEEINIALRSLQIKGGIFELFCEAGNYAVRLTDPKTGKRIEPALVPIGGSPGLKR